jgi:glycogen operon protein
VDATAQGYALGRFPAGLAEWNDRFRDSARRFWRGDLGQAPELATRLSGSQDLFGPSGRAPQASGNFATCHDGMTLHDWVSYSHKHNEANPEERRRAGDDFGSAGALGPATSRACAAQRAARKRNLLATVAFASACPCLAR